MCPGLWVFMGGGQLCLDVYLHTCITTGVTWYVCEHACTNEHGASISQDSFLSGALNCLAAFHLCDLVGKPPEFDMAILL